MNDLPQGIVTLVMTDIVGSTVLWDRFPQPMAEAVQRHNALIERCVLEQNGVLHKKRGEGDSTFSVFSDAADAVVCAAAIQFSMGAESWPTETQLRIRVAIHSGRLDPLDDDYFGDTPNRCARLREICHGGQAIASAVIRDLADRGLMGPATLRSLGRHRLRDLQVPEEVYQVEHPNLPRDFPPLKSVDAQPNNLPSRLSSFVGRARELAALEERLAPTRLLTLRGPGGCGKTRLAYMLAGAAMPRHQDGTWVVDLTTVSDDTGLARQLAATLDVREEPGQTLAVAIAHWIEHSTQLIVLDNCDRLTAAACGLVETFLKQCPNLTILATSRSPLGCQGESVYLVGPLEVSEEAEPSAVDLVRYEASRLFLERAAQVWPDFRVTDATAPIVVDICRRLGGNALAIELAAGQVDTHTLTELQRNLFALLTDGPRTAPERQQSLDRAIDWSYRELSPTEQKIFTRLAVFVGGWSNDAARAVIGGAAAEDDVRRLLAMLARRSLIERQALADDTLRYRMHEVLHAFGLRRLDESPDRSTVRRRHADYFLDLAEDAEPGLRTADRLTWIARLDPELDNLQAALRNLREGRRVQECLRLCGALWRYWYMRGLLTEGRDQIERALIMDEAATETPPRAKALHGAGTLAIMQGDQLAARRHLSEAVRLFNHLGDAEGAHNAIGNLAMSAFEAGDYGVAQELYGDVLAYKEAHGDQWGVATALDNLAATATELHDFVKARQHAEWGLALRRDLGDPRMVASSLRTLAQICLAVGDLQEAEQHCRASLNIVDGLGVEGDVAEAHWYLGEIAMQRDDLNRALAEYERSLETYVRMGAAKHAGLIEAMVSHVYWLRGDATEAAVHIARASERMPATAPIDYRARVLVIRALQAFADGLLHVARSDLNLALTESLAENTEAAGTAVVDCLDALAWIACQAGRTETALRLAAAADGRWAVASRHEYRPAVGLRDRSMEGAISTMLTQDVARLTAEGAGMSLAGAVAAAFDPS